MSLTSLTPKHRSSSDSKLYIKEIPSGYVKGNINLTAIVFSGFNLLIILNLLSLGQFA